MKNPFLLLALPLLLAAAPILADSEDPFVTIHQDILIQMEATSAARLMEREMLLMPDPTPLQLQFDVLHYDIVIAINEITQRVEGKVLVLLESTVDSLHSVELDADDVLAIHSVSLTTHGPLPWSHSGGIIHADLPFGLAAGEQIEIGIEYDGYPATAIEAGLFFRSYGGYPVIYSLSEPWSARTWWPCKDYPDDKATFDIGIAVDPSLTAASNGEFLGYSDTTHWGSDYRRYEWRENYPMSNYLFSVAISDYVRLDDHFVYAPGETMMVTNYVYPSKVIQATEDFNIQVPALDFFSTTFGLYPYTDEKYGVALTSIGGGMEHQTLTSYGAALTLGTHQYDYIYVHELAHQWFGDLVTCSDWVHIWLNEGWASYCEALWFEHVNGPDYLHTYMANKDTPGYWDGPVLRDPENDEPWYYFNTVVYHKGAWILHMLRHVMGDGPFFDAARAYLEDPRFRFSHADTDDFIGVFEGFYGGELDWFFDQWLTREDRPVYSWTYDKFTVGETGHLSLAVQQTQGDPYIMPVDLRVTTTAGVIDTVLWVDEIEESFHLLTSGTVLSVEFDPDDWILSYKTGIVTSSGDIPAAVNLEQNVPNPFNPSTTIGFSLEKGSGVKIEIFDVSGSLVSVLTDRYYPAGTHLVRWDGTGRKGGKVSSGIYFYRLTSPGFAGTRKMVLLR